MNLERIRLIVSKVNGFWCVCFHAVNSIFDAPEMQGCTWVFDD